MWGSVTPRNRGVKSSEDSRRVSGNGRWQVEETSPENDAMNRTRNSRWSDRSANRARNDVQLLRSRKPPEFDIRTDRLPICQAVDLLCSNHCEMANESGIPHPRVLGREGPAAKDGVERQRKQDDRRKASKGGTGRSRSGSVRYEMHDAGSSLAEYRLGGCANVVPISRWAEAADLRSLPAASTCTRGLGGNGE